MKKLIVHALAAAALAAGLQTQAAECAYPRAPASMPDGGTATLPEMVAAKKEYEKYNSDMGAYLECIKADHEASLPQIDPNMTDEAKREAQQQIDDSEKRYEAKNDSAVDELHAIMDRFNEQIRTFKAKLKAEKEKS